MIWILYELARHPDDQAHVREELEEARKRKRESGEEAFSANDYDSMPFFNAVIKVRCLFYVVLGTEYSMCRSSNKRRVSVYILLSSVCSVIQTKMMFFPSQNRLFPLPERSSTRFQ